MLLWPRLVCGGTAVPRSSPGPRLPKAYGRRPLAAPGALLVSPFNVKWRFSEPAGDVEGSKLCLFSVIMPAKCVSSISPRFHYRRVAFCFLPLAAIFRLDPSLSLCSVILGITQYVIFWSCCFFLSAQCSGHSFKLFCVLIIYYFLLLINIPQHGCTIVWLFTYWKALWLVAVLG
jgi:hypothetical protein